jgi:2-oxo-4-hydroxy-4-carboxy-5-ureidoimidazoline decarboxylase
MAENPIPLDEVNLLSEDEFVSAFGDVAEHAPWVAAEAADARPFASRDAMIAAFRTAIAAADLKRQRALLLAHPDLAGRAAIAGDLTKDSRREQAGAGLDRLTPAEFARFTALNDEYRRRFGIPFIFAVRGATKHDILGAFERRLRNSEEIEFAAALEQVNLIVSFRLEDRVSA